MVVRAMDVDWPAFDSRLRKDPFEGSAIVKAPGSAGGYLPRHVLPVIGPALVTVLHEDAQRPLFEVLAQPLAAKLGLPSGTWVNTMHVARDGARAAVCAARL